MLTRSKVSITIDRILQEFREGSVQGLSYQHLQPILKKYWNSLTTQVLSNELKDSYNLFISFTRATIEYNYDRSKINKSPYWKYICKSEHCIKEHSVFDGLVFRFDDAFWKKYYPPNSINCGCLVRPCFYDKSGCIESNINQHFKNTLNTIEDRFKLNPGVDDWQPLIREIVIETILKNLK